VHIIKVIIVENDGIKVLYGDSRLVQVAMRWTPRNDFALPNGAAVIFEPILSVSTERAVLKEL